MNLFGTDTGAKGSGIDASTYKTVDLARTWRPGDSRLQYIDLYSCNLDDAPARREDPGKLPP